jgi:hypothetical protein
MTSKEFVIWLKGFTEGVHDFNITPKQWDLLKERLSEVEDEENFVETSGMFQDHTRQSYPPYWDHRSPFHVTCGTSGSIDMGRSAVSVWSTDLTGSNITYTISSGSIGAGSVTYMYPNGTTVSYTTSTDKNWNIKNKDLLHD